MRSFLELSFKGTHYAGWQRQSNALTVQQEVEDAMSLVLRKPIKITGCGRTDTGVHARQFYAHFDFPTTLTSHHLKRINRILPSDILLIHCWHVSNDAHARFDACKRTYEYNISRRKDPFREETIFRFPQFSKADVELLVQVSRLIKEYREFFPFSKSKSDVNHYICEIFDSEWKFKNDQWVYSISANRFLRGMVRLIVGISLNVAIGKVSIDEVRESLDTQTRIRGSWSVPAQGLFLTSVDYPFNLKDVHAHTREILP